MLIMLLLLETLMLNYDVLLVHSGTCATKLKGCVAELGAAGVHGEMNGVPLSIIAFLSSMRSTPPS